MQGVLFLSAHYRWFWFNEYKGYTVLITVAATAIGLLLLVLGLLVSRFFRSKAQFGLMTLLLVIPIMAMPCAWLAREMELARQLREQAARARFIEFDSEENSHDFLTVSLGREFFQDVIGLNLLNANLHAEPHDPVGDAEIAQFKRLPKLKRLWLCSTDITDPGVKQVTVFADLRDLDLRNTQVVGSELGCLVKLQKLERLALGHTKVGDVGLEQIGRLTQLHVLDLSDTSITNAGLRHLKELKALQDIGLGRTEVSDEGIEHLKHLTKLRSVSLRETRVTDAGLEHLKGLSELKHLHLRQTAVTDAGLKHLEGLPNLVFLEINGTQVTPEGVARLKAAIPKCDVRHSK